MSLTEAEQNKKDDREFAETLVCCVCWPWWVIRWIAYKVCMIDKINTTS
jgi:hypothetical protein